MFQTPSERAVRRCWNMLPDDPTGNYVSNPFRAGGEALREEAGDVPVTMSKFQTPSERAVRRCDGYHITVTMRHIGVSNPFRAGGEALPNLI